MSCFAASFFFHTESSPTQRAFLVMEAIAHRQHQRACVEKVQSEKEKQAHFSFERTSSAWFFFPCTVWLVVTDCSFMFIRVNYAIAVGTTYHTLK